MWKGRSHRPCSSPMVKPYGYGGRLACTLLRSICSLGFVMGIGSGGRLGAREFCFIPCVLDPFKTLSSISTLTPYAASAVLGLGAVSCVFKKIALISGLRLPSDRLRASGPAFGLRPEALGRCSPNCLTTFQGSARTNRRIHSQHRAAATAKRRWCTFCFL